MGMILGYGLCSLFGLFYSAAHTVIPFILLGIGIDNIFVITQTFSTIGRSTKAHCQRKKYRYHIYILYIFYYLTEWMARLPGGSIDRNSLINYCGGVISSKRNTVTLFQHQQYGFVFYLYEIMISIPFYFYFNNEKILSIFRQQR